MAIALGSPNVVTLAGELDLATTPLVLGVCETLPRGDLVIDCAEVEFIDCYTLASLHAVGEHLRASGSTLEVRHLRPFHLLLVQLLALDEALNTMSIAGSAVPARRATP